MVDRKGYMHARPCTRPRSPAHPHTQIYNLLLFYGINYSRTSLQVTLYVHCLCCFLWRGRINSENDLLPSSSLPVPPSARISTVATGRIFVTFDTKDFKPVKKVQYCLKRDKNVGLLAATYVAQQYTEGTSVLQC